MEGREKPRRMQSAFEDTVPDIVSATVPCYQALDKAVDPSVEWMGNCGPTLTVWSRSLEGIHTQMESHMQATFFFEEDHVIFSFDYRYVKYLWDIAWGIRAWGIHCSHGDLQSKCTEACWTRMERAALQGLGM